jgi:hypothetical protein
MKIKFLIASLLISILVSCGTNTNDLAAEVQKSMEENFANENLEIEITSLQLVHKQGNEYSGILETIEDGEKFTYSVEVISDGDTFKWEIIE